MSSLRNAMTNQKLSVAINAKNNLFEVIALNITLFLYPFEFFDAIHHGALGELSPFRVIILPLCIMYLLIYRNKSNTKYQTVNKSAAGLLFCFSLLSMISSGTISSAFSIIGNAFQFFMAFVLFSRIGMNKSTLFVITTWTLVQIPVLIQSIMAGSIGMTSRFHGLFFDPNYLCSFVMGSIGAALYLIQNGKNKWVKYYSLGIIFLGLIMLFLSYSRGGLIGLFVVLIIYLFSNHKKLLITITIAVFPLLSTMFIRAQFITWSDAADNVFDAFLYRTITLSDDADMLTSHRANFIDIFVRNIDNYIFFGTDLETYVQIYNHGTFPHNGFIELMIQAGVIVGSFYILRLLVSIIKEVRMSSKYKAVPCELIIGLGILIPLTFLSYTSKIAWLCMGMLFSLSSERVFKSHLS